MTNTIEVQDLGNNSYTITVNGELFIQTSDPILNLNEIINVFKNDALFNDCEIIYTTSEKNVSANINMDLENKSDIDFDKLNDEIGFEANTHTYRDTFFNTDTIIEDESKETVDESTNDVSNEPVGSVECPNAGDLVYIDGQDGLLSTITGGVCTVSMIYKSEDPVVVDTIEHESYGGWGDLEIEIEEITEDNILFEVEEFPGTYFSWTMLKDKQEELQLQYGYKPACKI